MNAPDVLCVGSVLWDLIGRTGLAMDKGSDVPGRITRLPGGVALNIAMTLSRFDISCGLLSAIGCDSEGVALMAACEEHGLITDHVYRPQHLPTDRYMAIEDEAGLVAALADAHSLEAAGDAILTPLEDGSLGSAGRPFAGILALDGNLTEALLSDIAQRPSFAAADLRIAPASPGKARRLRPLMGHGGATLYVNREEAGLITGTSPRDAGEGASALIAAGATRVLVTDGARMAVDASLGEVHKAPARKVAQRRITGAGDTFMAAHIAAELRGAARPEALECAQDEAARYVAGEKP